MSKKRKKEETEQEQLGPVVHRTKECEFCGHLYIEPCDSRKKASSCPNTKL